MSYQSMVMYEDDIRAAPEMGLEVFYFNTFLSDLFY